jgi:H+/gluconate symporter-like permease
MVTGILIIITFLVFSVLTALRKINAIYALILMAVFIAILGGMPFLAETSIMSTVLVDGTLMLSSTVFLIIIAAWLSQVMFRTGISNTIIKKAAELGGDNPIILTIVLSAACVFLFTALFGTGAAMMLGTIVLPILLTIGVPPVKAVSIFLATMGIGFGINVPNMAPILNITDTVPRDLLGAGIVIMITGTGYLLWLMWTVFRKGARKFAFASPVEEISNSTEEFVETQKTVKGVRGFLACLTPILLVILVYAFEIPPLACFYLGIVWVIIMTFDGKYTKYFDMLTGSFYAGTKDAGPPIAICLGIGMALKAMMFTGTQDALVPLLKIIIPTAPVALAIFMAIGSPLNLYRGPFSLWGLGSGFMGVMLLIGGIPEAAIAALFLTQMRWGNVCDATGTITVWSSNFVGSDPVTISNVNFVSNYITQIIALPIVVYLYMVV